MIVVDSSVWVDALRDKKSVAAIGLGELLEEDRVALVAPVRAELLLGAPRAQEARLARLLSALPCWYPDREDWSRVEQWIEPALRAGQRFGVVDMLIAAMASGHQAAVWSRDHDFRRLAKLGFVDLFRP